MTLRRGDTFLNESSAGVPTHFWVIISDPSHTVDRIVIVNLTSWRGLAGEDESCVLDKGDHPFVKHKTYVNYRDALIVEACKIENLHASGLLTHKEPVNDSILLRILEGAQISPFLKLKIRKFLENQDLI